MGVRNLCLKGLRGCGLVSSQRQDKRNRALIVTELQQNFFVEAGAGSGKTTSLIQRMIALLAAGTCSVSEIVAITFTRKAAAELRERMQTELEKRLRLEGDKKIRKRLEDALSNLHLCFLGTIHSFCGKLLRERPVEAGVDADFAEVEGEELASIQRGAWERYLSETQRTDPTRLSALQDLGLDLSSLYSGYERLLLYPDVFFPREKLPLPDFDPVVQELIDLVTRAARSIPDPPREGRYDALQEKVRSALRRLSLSGLDTTRECLEVLRPFAKAQKVTQKLWDSKTAAKEYEAEFALFAEAKVTPLLHSFWEYCYEPVLSFLEPALEVFSAVKQELVVLDLQDLLMRATKMLREHPMVRTYFQGKYTRIFMDEFQDTDPVQAELLMCLTSEDKDETDWRKMRSKPGSLFVVGDPKQSIYRFRRADLDMYHGIKDQIGTHCGQITHLTANFRSVFPIGEFCNIIFSGIFSAQGMPFQANYTPMETNRESEDKDGVWSLPLCPKDKDIRECLEKEAEMIALLIREYVEEKLFLPKDFMILTRYKGNLSIYARALEEQGIPVRMSGESSFGENRELKELYKLCRALGEPDDTIALVSVLRGVFFGFSDADLARFREAGGAFHLYVPVPEGLDVSPLFATAYEKLKEYTQYTRRFPPAVALEKIVTDLGILPYLLAGELGESRGGHVMRLLEGVRLDGEGITSWRAFVGYFEGLMIQPPEEEIGMDPRYENAVSLMNLHKAKGLEAEVVFLANPYKAVKKEVEIHVTRKNGVPTGYLRFVKKQGYALMELARPKNWESYAEKEEKYDAAEGSRLIYVATTRAKRMLIISTPYEDKSSRNPWACLQSKSLPCLTVKNRPPVLHVTSTAPLPRYEDTMGRMIQRLAEASYHTLNPSTQATGLGSVAREEGGGMRWGNANHQVLDAYVRGSRDLDAIMAQVIEENELEKDREAELRSMVERFQKRLGARLKNAKEVLTEVPFSLQVSPSSPLHVSLSEPETRGKRMVLSGVIDLIFREEKGWVIVDYKSDRVSDPEDRRRLTDHYRTQIETYGKAWWAIAGEPVDELYIYYLENDELVQL